MTEQSTGQCKDCRHWGEPSNIDKTFRQCVRVVHSDNCNHATERLFNEDDPDHIFSDNEATVIDGSDYLAKLLTKPDFGCVLFEERNNVPANPPQTPEER